MWMSKSISLIIFVGLATSLDPPDQDTVLYAMYVSPDTIIIVFG